MTKIYVEYILSKCNDATVSSVCGLYKTKELISSVQK